MYMYLCIFIQNKKSFLKIFIHFCNNLHSKKSEDKIKKIIYFCVDIKL